MKFVDAEKQWFSTLRKVHGTSLSLFLAMKNLPILIISLSFTLSIIYISGGSEPLEVGDPQTKRS